MVPPHMHGEAKIRAPGSFCGPLPILHISLGGWGSLGHINNDPYESNKCLNS
jgi:hypothetical protein